MEPSRKQEDRKT